LAGAWEPRRLFESYRHRRFRCGEDNAGYPVKMKLKYFLRYMHECKDDSPMYVFDSMYNDDKTPAGLLQDYRVPHYFKEDLFAAVGEHRRPPYRWMLLGPKRSGTGVHIDPLATSAWNTLLYGRKRWVIFSPSFTKGEVKGRELVRKDRGEDDEPVDYFTNILPRVRERIGRQVAAFRAGAASTMPGPHETPALPSPARAPLSEPTGEDPTGGLMSEFTQYPGETVFVPGGWWHAVMNLDDTIAVTQNFASTTNFSRVWTSTRDGRRGMARKWLRALRTTRPDLAAIADASNKAVGWEPTALAARHKARVVAKTARLKAKAEAKAAAAAARGGDSSDDSDSSNSSSEASTSSGSVTSASSGSRKVVRKKAGESREPCSSSDEA
jgi:histone arginine demethylase JMJD6